MEVRWGGERGGGVVWYGHLGGLGDDSEEARHIGAVLGVDMRHHPRRALTVDPPGVPRLAREAVEEDPLEAEVINLLGCEGCGAGLRERGVEDHAHGVVLGYVYPRDLFQPAVATGVGLGASHTVERGAGQCI